MEEYNLKPLIQNGRVLAECRTCIYGLPQEGRFAYIKIVKHLAGECYFPTMGDSLATSLDDEKCCRNCVDSGPKRAKMANIVFTGQKWARLEK